MKVFSGGVNLTGRSIRILGWKTRGVSLDDCWLTKLFYAKGYRRLDAASSVEEDMESLRSLLTPDDFIPSLFY